MILRAEISETPFGLIATSVCSVAYDSQGMQRIAPCHCGLFRPESMGRQIAVGDDMRRTEAAALVDGEATMPNNLKRSRRRVAGLSCAVFAPAVEALERRVCLSAVVDATGVL